MDKEIQQPARIDPPITVEPAEPLTPAADTRPAGSVCTHRLTWRELTVPAKYRVALHAALAVAVLAVALWLVVEGATAVRTASADGDAPKLGLGLTTAATGLLLPVGPIAFLRLWRLPHKPARAAFILHNVALGMLAFVASASGNEWLTLAVLPAFAITQELGKFRLILTERATCATDPTMPLSLRIRREGDLEHPADDAERAYVWGPREIIGDFDSWSCPHLVTWSQTRRRARVRAMLDEFAWHLYEFGLFAVAVAVLRNSDRLPIPVFSEPSSLGALVIVAVLGALHLSVRKARSVGPFRHLALGYGSTYTLAFGAAAAAAAVASWTALALDRPYLWLVVPLALHLVFNLAENLVINTPISQCKARPELHPRIRSWLKA